jgi:hypothetical protein
MSPRHPEDFTAIDRHARQPPRRAERSIPGLAAYLTGPAQNPREAARAIFRWITEHIAYDTHAARRRSHRPGNGDAAEALARRVAVCGGIAGLYQGLAEAAGLEAVTISGHSKGQGYAVEKSLRSRPDHAWNAVRLEGKWQLLDATWGGGAFMGRTYQRRFDGHYFLTPPDAFIYDHFPEDPAWQLLPRPITLRRFEQLPFLKSAFFHCGMGLASHPDARIVANGVTRVALSAPPEVRVHAKLRGAGQSLPASLVFVQREGEHVAVHAAPPHSGSYTLRVFAKPPDEPEAYEWALDYRLRAARGAGIRAGFPLIHGAFTESGAVLHRPFERYLRAGKAQRFELSVPGAEEAVVAGRNLWRPLEISPGGFSGRVEVPKGKVTVAARFPGGRAYDVLLAYTGY